MKFISLETSSSSSGDKVTAHREEKTSSSAAVQPLVDMTGEATVVSGSTVSQPASVATQYVPPPLPPRLSEPMVKCMRHLAGEGVNPDRTKPLTVCASLPIIVADYSHHHIAYKVLDILERPASLPEDRMAWLDYITEEIVGGEDLSGAYTIVRLSVAGMLAMHELMTAGAEMRCHYRDAQITLPVCDMLSGITPSDVGVSTIMSRDRLITYMDTAMIVEQPRLELGDFPRAPTQTPTSPPTTVEQTEVPRSAQDEEPVRGQAIPSTSRVADPLEEAAPMINNLCLDDSTLTVPETQMEDSGDSFEVIAGHDDSAMKAMTSTSADPVLGVTAVRSSSCESINLLDAPQPTLTSSPLGAKLSDSFDLGGYDEEALLNFPSDMDDFEIADSPAAKKD